MRTRLLFRTPTLALALGGLVGICAAATAAIDQSDLLGSLVDGGTPPQSAICVEDVAEPPGYEIFVDSEAPALSTDIGSLFEPEHAMQTSISVDTDLMDVPMFHHDALDAPLTAHELALEFPQSVAVVVGNVDDAVEPDIIDDYARQDLPAGGNVVDSTLYALESEVTADHDVQDLAADELLSFAHIALPDIVYETTNLIPADPQSVDPTSTTGEIFAYRPTPAGNKGDGPERSNRLIEVDSATPLPADLAHAGGPVPSSTTGDANEFTIRVNQGMPAGESGKVGESSPADGLGPNSGIKMSERKLTSVPVSQPASTTMNRKDDATYGTTSAASVDDEMPSVASMGPWAVVVASVVGSGQAGKLVARSGALGVVASGIAGVAVGKSFANATGSSYEWKQGAVDFALGVGLVYLGAKTVVTVHQAVRIARATGLGRAAVKYEKLGPVMQSKYTGRWFGRFGYTTRKGEVVLNEALKQPHLKRLHDTAHRHELLHALTTPRGNGFLATLRRKVRWWAYDNSHALRYIEEALAQLVGTRKFMTALRFPFSPAYGISKMRVLLESLGAGVVYTGAVHVASRKGKAIADDISHGMGKELLSDDGDTSTAESARMR